MSHELNNAIELFNAFKLDEAKTIFEQILENENENISALLYLGKIYLKENEHGKALDKFNKVLELQADNSEANTNIALLKSILNLNNNYYYENPYTDDNLYSF